MALPDAGAKIDCVYARDGIYALEKLADKSFRPNIIFLDINMPRMNGIDCLVELKKIKELENVPVYMYSTSSETGIVEKCKQLGATSFIEKLPSIDKLQVVFNDIFKNLGTSEP
jgi:CheY-like chemotaxis protein